MTNTGIAPNGPTGPTSSPPSTTAGEPAAPPTDLAELLPGRQALIRYRGDFLDLIVETALGSWLTTVDGRQILDFTSGQMCATLGHRHPALTTALTNAADRVLHLPSKLLSPDVIRLAGELLDLLPEPLRRAMFVATGGESNDAALRLAKLYTGGFEVLALAGSWHGMVGGAASATYVSSRRGYGPTTPGNMALPTPNCYRCPVRHCRDKCDLTCLDVGMDLVDSQSVGAPAAVVVEPVLSSGGIVPLPPGYLARLRALTAERGYLLIVDEAQTAFGRAGRMFAFEKHDVVPDVVTVSKTLGGGVPIAAVITTAEIEDAAYRENYVYFSSHMCDPLGATVARAVLATVAGEGLVERAARMGEYLRCGLHRLQDEHEAVGDVRGEGLLLALDLVVDRESRRPATALAQAVVRRCLELGLNINVVKSRGGGSVLRIAPPMTVTADECDHALDILDRALTSCTEP